MPAVFIMSRLSETFISWPERDFFLKHLVCINYSGKVYAILRGIEMAAQTEGLHQALYITYAVCMLLGTFWYTRFWIGDDLDLFYKSRNHILHTFGVTGILLGATIYYFTFGILFTLAYNDNSYGTALALALWNYWCAILLLLANFGTS